MKIASAAVASFQADFECQERHSYWIFFFSLLFVFSNESIVPLMYTLNRPPSDDERKTFPFGRTFRASYRVSMKKTWFNFPRQPDGQGETLIPVAIA
ncbi:hypothetical protein CDAR_230201 [Caerostris darwini]|uniref:Uncharacterized protein n=1 Tax=Caerostris darwini TaxID=1538125 RepID=A0AAV4MJS6_9ARAC|nr:hypothetical protein CDAR_230201 [Caerostris darwini]